MEFLVEDNRFYVYELIDPRNNQPFYVGKGCDRRANTHLIEAAKPRHKQVNTFKCAVINNILASGYEVGINYVKTDMVEADAYAFEAELIEQYGKRTDKTGILTNLADGGAGGTGIGKYVCQHTLEGVLVATYKTLTEAGRIVGINKSTICAALNGRTELAGGFRWCYMGETIRPYNPPKTVAVDQYDLDGTFIRSYKTVVEAANAVNIHTSSILDLLNHNRNSTAGGFRWAKAGEQLKEMKHPSRVPNLRKEFQCYDTAGNLVGRFATIKDAITATPANATGISDCCAGRKKTSGGLVWKVIMLPR